MSRTNRINIFEIVDFVIYEEELYGKTDIPAILAKSKSSEATIIEVGEPINLNAKLPQE